MAAAVGYLGAHLVAAGYMALLYRFRSDYADEDKDRWNREFRDNRDKPSPWPYIQRIENLALFLHVLNVLGPLVSGVLLIASMFVQGN